MLRRRIQRPEIFEAKGIYRNLDEFDKSTGPKKGSRWQRLRAGSSGW
jgi:hypothetical protein